jgi:hypothetical protein
MISQPTLESGKMRVDGRNSLWNCGSREPAIGQETNEPLHAAHILERWAIVPAPSAPLAAVSSKSLDDVIINGIDRDTRTA